MCNNSYMGKALYKDTTELLQAIEKYLKTEPKPTPRHFRAIGLGVSKSLLSHWRKEKPEYFNLIKNAEDLILAVMEQKFSYGGKEMYNLNKTMKAYDEDYREETYQIKAALKHQKDQDVQLPTIILPKTAAPKGVQSDRKLKKLPKK